MTQIIYPLTHAQKRIWYTEQTWPGSSFANLCLTIKIKDVEDTQLLTRSLNDYISKNDIMRVRLTETDDGVRQYFTNFAKTDIEKLKFENEESCNQWIRRFVETPFDLIENPLYALRLIKTPDQGWRIVFLAHHIISDGWTHTRAALEFGKYCKNVNGGKTDKNDNAASYTNYIQAEKTYLQSEDFLKDKNFWIDNLSPIPEPTRFAFGSTNAQKISCNREVFSISNTLWKSIDEFSKNNQVSHFNLFMAALAVYAARTNRSDDVVLITANHGRANEKLGKIAGMFVATLPIRIQLDQNQEFLTLAKNIDSSVKTILKTHTRYPFDQLVTDLRERSKSFTGNLSDIAFVLVPEIPLNDIEFEQHVPGDEATPLSMHLFYRKNEDNFLTYDYQTDLFDAQDIQNLHESLFTIIKAAIISPHNAVSMLPLLSNDKLKENIKLLSGPESEFPKDSTLHGEIEKAAARFPDRQALVCNSKWLNYRQLDEHSSSLARTLRAKGIRPDNLVGLLLHNSINAIVAIIAIQKAGAAYVPLDPDYPAGRIEYILDDSQASLLITTKELNETKVRGYKGQWLNIEDNELYDADSSKLEPVAGPTNLAYVIYTSGSTGKPKGVMLEHRGPLNYVYHYAKFYDLTENDNFPLYSSICFDASVPQIFAPLMSGSTLHILEGDIRMSPIEVNEYFEKNNITGADFPTQFGEQFMELTDNQSLKNMVVGGDKLTRFFNRNYRIVNEYGPTENSVSSTRFVVDRAYKRVPIGKANNNCQCYVLDASDHMLPPGIPGELCVSGVGLARGYLNLPDKTKECFVTHPYKPEHRMYRTGDLVRYLPDGNIEFLDRVDFQVKIRGYRIELTEIDLGLLQHEDISEAVVLAKEDKNGNKYLCAWLVTRRDVSIQEIKAHLASELPNYMIPEVYMVLDKMPLNISGKIDRHSLPEPAGVDSRGVEYLPPKTVIEKKLARIFEDILEMEQVGLRHHFFDCGGHSLKASVLQVRIQNEMGVKVFLSQIFKMPTVSALAQLIKGTAASDIFSIEQVPEQEYYPLSAGQRRLFIMDEMDPGNTTYNVPYCLLLKGPIDLSHLADAIDQVISRHECLRTSFHLRDGVPVQVIHDTVRVKRVLKDGIQEEIQSLFKQFLRSFNLQKAPLFRTQLVKISPDEHVLMLDFHHIVLDGFSLSVFMRDLSGIYTGKKLKTLPLRFRDFAAWQNDFIGSDKIKTMEQYWLSKFYGDLPSLNIITDKPRGSVASYKGHTLPFELDSALKQKLIKLTDKTGTTLFMLLLSAWKILLAKYSNQDDIVVGIPASGRPTNELDDVVGMFVNTLAIRSHPKPKMIYEDYLATLKEDLLGAFDNQTFQFDALVEKLDIKRTAGRSPLFDVMFSYENFINHNYDFGELSSSGMDVDWDIAKFDLTLSIADTDQGFDCRLEYRSTLFEANTIGRMGEQYRRLLENIATNENANIADLSLMSKEEAERSLFQFNIESPSINLDCTLHGLIEQTALIDPEHIALVDGKIRLSYAELNRRANQLAYTLRKKGVGPDDMVGLWAKRYHTTIVAMLAIMKAGGAYLPIDPKSPNERVRYIMEDSGAALLLTPGPLTIEPPYKGETLDLNDPANYDTAVENLKAGAGPRNLAYVIYTSGSTGKPKGVLIEHRSAVNYLQDDKDFFEITSADKIAEYFSFSFDGSIHAFSALIAGATMHLIPDNIRLSPNAINTYFEKNNISGASFPTPFAEQFMQMVENKSLRFLMFGGEKLKTNVERPYRIVDEYGPTETTVAVTRFVLDQHYERSPIGKPVSNMFVYILDEGNNPMPMGVPGELCVSGPGVSRGYHNRPELTSKVFLPDPFRKGHTMYRTGDLARWLPDGNVDFLGRLDFQVKIRGFRIEIGEIEQAMVQLDEIREAAVLVKQDGNDRNWLCGYFVANSKIDSGKVKSLLARTLPDYMIPQTLIKMESMPLNTSGKIDRHSLPEPEQQTSTGEVGEPLETENEKIIAQAWQEVLNVPVLSKSDNFFSLGGHSLKAIAAVAGLSKNFDITVNQIFENQTVKELALAIKRIQDNLKIKLSNLKDRVEQAVNAPPVDPKDEPELKPLWKNYDRRIGEILESDLSSPAPYGHVLLTGATGYLGVFLLKDLLENTDAKVTCIVRAESNEAAVGRVDEKSFYYFDQSLSQSFPKRLQILSGDLSADMLGLSTDAYQNLSITTDAILHSAANVRHYGHYEEFEKANVQSTRNLIKMAEDGNKADMHLVSTLSVGNGEVDGIDKTLFTEFDGDISQKLDNYYLKTKLESEELVVQARTRGLKGNIYRIGNITFDTQRGRLQSNIEENAFFTVLKSFVNLGVIPDVGQQVEFAFVDQVARAIRLLHMQKPLLDNCFHLQNAKPVLLSDALTVKDLDIPLEKLSFREFVDFLLRHFEHAGFRDHIEKCMLHLGWLEDESPTTMFFSSSEMTDQVLEKLGFVWPELKPTQLDPMILHALNERVKELSDIPHLLELPQLVLQQMAKQVRQEIFEDDEELLVEGEENHSFHFIVDGHVELSRKSVMGWTGSISVLSPGDFTGEGNMFGDGPGNVNADAILGQVRTFSLSREKMQRLLADHPLLAFALLKGMNQRINRMEALWVNAG